jgi:RNA polymerase sigma-70 factor (ECF subfamily)
VEVQASQAVVVESVIDLGDASSTIAAREEPYTPGSQRDFDRLYRASYQRLLYTILAVVGDYQAAEDCTQEAFVRAYRTWKDWRPDAPAEAWLHRIALNAAFSHLRWRKLRQLPEIVRRLGSPRSDSGAADIGLRSELLAALGKLPREQAATIILRHHHGYTNREIALALNVAESTVASRLAAAKQRLRRELE